MYARETVAGRLLAALERKGGPICDDCLTLGLGLTRRQHVNSEANTMSRQGKLDRSHGTCTKCGNEKLVNQPGTK